MSWTRLILDFVSHNAWPAILLTVIVVFRNEISALFRAMRDKLDDATEVGVDAGPVKLKILAELARVKQVVQGVDPNETQSEATRFEAGPGKSREADEAIALSFVDVYTQITVLLRREVARLRGGVDVPPDYDPVAAATVLAFNGVIRPAAADAIRVLGAICNGIVEGGIGEFDIKAIEDSRDLALTILKEVSDAATEGSTEV